MAIAILSAYKCVGTNAANEHLLTSSQFAFLSADATTVNTVLYPIAIPSDAGDSPNYSYECWIRWKLLNTPGGYIQNLKMWHSSVPVAASVYLMMGTITNAQTPVQTVSSVAIATASDNYYDISNCLYIPIASTIDEKLTTAGDATQYVVMQIKVAHSAELVVPSMLYYLSYEEVG